MRGKNIGIANEYIQTQIDGISHRAIYKKQIDFKSSEYINGQDVNPVFLCHKEKLNLEMP